jgi:EutQ-like cupin domain
VINATIRTGIKPCSFNESIYYKNMKSLITIGRGILEPGWSWEKCVKPLVKTNSCQAPHTEYIVSGRIRVVMDDGTEDEFGAGDATIIPPGHNAWVVGNEPVVAIDFTGLKDYAKKE